MKTSHIWWIITLLLDILVYVDKVLDFKVWYVDNLIKMYFVYYVAVSLVTFLVVICLIYLSSHVSHVTSSHEKTLGLAGQLDKPFIKISKGVSTITTILFGVFGCWWFFIFSCIQLCCTLIIMQQAKEIVKTYKKLNPDAKIPETQPEQNKTDKKAKFKFLKTS